ncbi:MAG TPA: hypothetical protein EYG85_01210 [Crocinitomix sp.]|nr:hypothetical protein [Crocinitomix sp.]
MKIFKADPINQINVLDTIVKVNQLTSFDMIYVYHLLSIGTTVKLYKTNINLHGDYMFDVYFKKFKIGVVKISGIGKQLIGDLTEVEAKISSLSKEKYLPLKSLELVIKSKNSLKMVG